MLELIDAMGNAAMLFAAGLLGGVVALVLQELIERGIALWRRT